MVSLVQTGQAKVLKVYFDTVIVSAAEMSDLPTGVMANVGIVTLPWGEREASAAPDFSGGCDGGPPCVHRHSAKLAVRLG
jgi:hypothetical protein